MLSEEWESFKSCVSEICLKRIRVNQGVGVLTFFDIDFCDKVSSIVRLQARPISNNLLGLLNFANYWSVV